MTRGEIITKWVAVCKIPIHSRDISALVGMLEMHGYVKQELAAVPVTALEGDCLVKEFLEHFASQITYENVKEVCGDGWFCMVYYLQAFESWRGKRTLSTKEG